MRLKHLILATLLVGFFACAKEDELTDPPAPTGLDITKFVDKEWYAGYKGNPPALSFRFNTDRTGAETLLTNWLPPYAYTIFPYKWERLGPDSIVISNWNNSAGVSAKFRILTLNDSVLITNNWIMLGAGDTVKNRFQTY